MTSEVPAKTPATSIAKVKDVEAKSTPGRAEPDPRPVHHSVSPRVAVTSAICQKTEYKAAEAGA
jgi:hypothetical protein